MLDIERQVMDAVGERLERRLLIANVKLNGAPSQGDTGTPCTRYRTWRSGNSDTGRSRVVVEVTRNVTPTVEPGAVNSSQYKSSGCAPVLLKMSSVHCAWLRGQSVPGRLACWRGSTRPRTELRSRRPFRVASLSTPERVVAVTQSFLDLGRTELVGATGLEPVTPAV